MHAIWNGAAPAPPTGTTYSNVSNPIGLAWQGNETFSGNAEAGSAISDPVNIVKVTFYVTNAPGTGNSWAFKIRQNYTDTTAVVTVGGGATSATWTGSIYLAQLDWLSVSVTSSGSPAAAGNVYWTIEYNSIGSDYYLMVGFAGSNQIYPVYCNPTSVAFFASSTATDVEVVVPTTLTVTKIAGSHVLSSGGSSGYAYVVRKNDSVDSAAINVVTQAVGPVSMAFAAGDTMVIKRTNVDANGWVAPHFCLTVVPGFVGEIMNGFGNVQAPSTTAVSYEGLGLGANTTWSTSEASVYVRISGVVLKNFYVKLASAPAGSASRTFTIRSNASDTLIAATVIGANTTANDSANSVSHIDGNFFSVSTTPSGSPAATSGVKFGFVAVVPQPAVVYGNQFFQMFK